MKTLLLRPTVLFYSSWGGKTLAISDKNLATFVNTNLAYLSVRLDCYFCTKNEAGHAICWVEWQLKLTDDLR